MIRSVCVFCGSAAEVPDGYLRATRALAREAVGRRLRVVYGGASVGLMGTLADAVLESGGTVIGVIPKALVDRELAHTGLTELTVVNTMHERKAKMAALSDAFIALPGGLGTLEELFEVWTWGMLGLHDKPYGVLNVDGYYDALIRFLDHASTQGFVRPDQRAKLAVEHDPSRLFDAIGAAVPSRSAPKIAHLDRLN